MSDFDYTGKWALVVGGASGIGKATAELAAGLGADVVVMDFAEVTTPGVTWIPLDLRDRDSIDVAVDSCQGPIHAVFSCAGVANETPGVDLINFVGQRHLIERLLDQAKLVSGGAVAMIASVAGLGWERNLDALLEYLDTPDFEAAQKWLEANPDKSGYGWSKQAVCAYIARQAYPFLKRGVRINGILPGPTDTPLARANAEVWLGFANDYRESLGISASTPEEQAYPLLFLCSDAARHVNGVSFVVDAGYVSAGTTGMWDAPVIRQRLGRDG